MGILEEFSNASGTEWFFWACALGGTLFFMLKVAMMVIGGFGADTADHAMDMDGHDHAGGGHGEGGGHAYDEHVGSGAEASNASFKLLSMTSLTGFFMMFGWAGLAAYKQYSLHMGISAVIAAVAGFATMWITAWMFSNAARLVSQGATFRIEAMVGKRAQVYQRIPGEGRGKVQLVADGMTRELEAVSEDKSELPSFIDVDIVKVVDATTVSVRRAA